MSKSTDKLNKNNLASPYLLIAVAFFAGALGGGLVGQLADGQLLTNSSNDQIRVEAKVYDESSQMIEAIEKAKPAVVSIVATKDLQVVRQSPFGFPFSPFQIPENQQLETLRQQVSGGTGFIIEEDGLILTNKHVVQDSEADYTVVMTDGSEYPAEVISLDPANDLAIIQVYISEDKEKPKNLPYLDFAQNTELKVGQKVIAIGNALGEFENTVTSGIVSAESRQIEATDSLGFNRDVLTNLLQTDAAINQGNSGGPLINLEGQVIGVNTAIASNANGIGFAIPIEDVAPVVSSVKKYGKILRPQLGVRYVPLNEAKAEELELAISDGALLIGDEANGLFAVMPGSAAEKAQLKMDDVITEVNGKKLTQEFGLKDAIRNLQPGDEVEIKVWRDGQTITKKIVLDEYQVTD